MTGRRILLIAPLTVIVVAGSMILGTGNASAKPIPCYLPGADLACKVGGDAVKDVAAGSFEAIVNSMLEGFGRQLEWALSWWVALPSPALGSGSGQVSPVLATVREYTTGLQVLLMTGAVLLTAARLMMAKRGGLPGQIGLAAETQESFLTFARAVFASWMFAAVITAGTRAGDSFSTWVLLDITHNDAVNVLHNMVSFDSLVDRDGGLGLGAMFILGTIGFIGALIQVILLVIRQALLIVVVALLPVAASAAGTGPGSGAYKRLLTWSIAFVLFKPVGALVYVVAFAAAGTPGNDPQMALLGLILLALVALVLPAIMRMVAPAVATMGSGSGAGAAMALGALGGLAASGAASAAGSASGARGVTESVHSGSSSNSSSRQSASGSGPNGGRVMTGGESSTAATNSGGGGGRKGSQQPTPNPAVPTGGSTAPPTGTSTASSAAGGAAGGPWMAAAHAGVQAGSSAANQVRDQVANEIGPDEPGPMEVRR
ncbi:hypothetical protein ACQPXH_00295 [Nocardia sp. CA-135953]|uniref:hypothetical protein n=1 Tax=Nocardia sp. CA-135953 TaxID=3239978 RepID=UPI003D95182B